MPENTPEEFDTTGIDESEVADLIAWAADEAKAAVQELIALVMDSVIESNSDIELNNIEKKAICDLITSHQFSEPPTVKDVKDCCKKCVEKYVDIANGNGMADDADTITIKSVGEELKKCAKEQQKAKETLESAQEKGSVFSRITTGIIDTGKSVATYAYNNPKRFLLLAGALIAGGAAGVGISAAVAAGMAVPAAGVLATTTAGTGSLLSTGTVLGSATAGTGTVAGLLKGGSAFRKYRAKNKASNSIKELAKAFVKRQREQRRANGSVASTQTTSTPATSKPSNGAGAGKKTTTTGGKKKKT